MLKDFIYVNLTFKNVLTLFCHLKFSAEQKSTFKFLNKFN